MRFVPRSVSGHPVTEHDTQPDTMPTFEEAIITAAAILRQAHTHVGMTSAEQLTSIGDSWLGMASLIHQREDHT